MIKVFKYELVLTDEQTIELPKGFSILHIKYQHSIFNMWCEVDTDAASEMRTFFIYGTGQEIPNREDISYIQTAVTNDGALVWHIFGETPLLKTNT